MTLIPCILNGQYCELSVLPTMAVQVPLRPGDDYIWNAANSSWEAVPPQIPTVVTMHQARAALINAGLFDSVNNAISAMTGTAGQLARNDWEFSPILNRDHTLVASLSTALGLTSAQLDNLFTAAALL
ncbi:MAG: hypothetical protein ACYCZR_02655 [Burkholderiales bacterium]